MNRPLLNRTAATLAAATCFVAAASVPSRCAAATQPTFYMGGDISMLPFLEGRGATYRDDGVVRPAEQIMVNHGANLFRLRLFVNPSSNYDAPSNHGAIQDLNYDIALAQRLKATGAKFALALHYSDTWADPGHQTIPAAWSGQTFDQLKTTVHDYTLSTLNAFRAAGVMPDFVQIGNETTSGMLWPQGQLVFNQGTAALNASWNKFGQLVNSAIKGVRDAQQPGEHVDVLLTVAPGDEYYSASQGGLPRWFYDNFNLYGGVSDYDTLAIDSYPINTGSLSGLQSNFTDLATRYNKPVLLMETNQPWKSGSVTGAYPSTPTGQHDYLAAIRDTVRNLPNNKGLGVMWWYPESVVVPNTFIWQNGGIALWDDSKNALPAMSALSISTPTWNVDGDGNWYNAMNWVGGVPMFAGNAASFGSAITTPHTVTMNAPESAAILSFNNANAYTIAGASTLTLDAVAGNAAINVLAGSHLISAPLKLNDNLDLAIAPAASVLTISEPFDATGRAITKSGVGAARFARVRAGSLILNDGTVAILPNGTAAATSGLTSLTLAGGASPTATLDLADNAMVLDYPSGSASPLSMTLAQAGYAYDNGARDRAGIKSSQSDLVIGAAEASDLGGNIPPIFGAVDGSAVLVRATLSGDANLDGVVDTLDFNSLASHFGNSGGAVWSQGDFNYDGAIDTLDFNSLAANFGESLPASTSAFVPESMSASLVVFMTVGSLSQAKRRCG